MAACSASAFVKAYPMRLIFCLAFVCVVAFYPLTLRSGLASFLNELPSLRSPCTCSHQSALQDRGSDLFHSWPDDELFARAILADAPKSADTETDRRASSPASRKSSPSSACQARRADGSPAKIAFMFLTQGPLPFLPLWSRFLDGHEHLYNLYVHLDPFRVGVFDRKTAGVFWGRLIPSGLTQRGAPSLAAAARRLIANALLDDPLNQYFAILSERCIPLVSFRRTYDTLTASEKSFIEILSGEPTLRSRYMSRGAEATMLPEVPFSSFRVGSQFFVLSRKHAAMVVADKKIWRKFSTPCEYANSCYTEEHYFPTLINIADGKCATGFTTTNVDWSVRSRDAAHPRSYRPEEVKKELIVSLRRNGTFLFARKFEDGCLERLLELAPFTFEEDMGGKGQAAVTNDAAAAGTRGVRKRKPKRRGGVTRGW